jgi:PncC family amidohydrolase
VIAYSNETKVKFLGVSQEALIRYGAVSEPVAREMAEGARGRFSADWGVGVTGIAGPTGGTSEKPVGLVYIAVAGAGETIVVKRVFSGTREEIKRQTAEKALEMLRECLA